MGIQFSMNVEGVEKLQAALDKMPGLMHTAAQRSLERVGEDIHMDTFRMCPVRTGYLRSTIFHRVQDWILAVGAAASYAPYVEFGTTRMPGRFFLTEAFHLNFPKLQQVLEWALDAALKAALQEA